MNGREVPMPKVHKVKQGESVASIAYAHGLLPSTIWDDPQNSEIKERRSDPNVLAVGDEIFVPDNKIKWVSMSTDKKHKLVRRSVPEKLQIRFLDASGEPRAGISYEFEIDGEVRSGTTNDKGEVIESIMPDANQATIRFSEEELYRVKIGHLDPVTEITGLQARLRNLGYYEGEVDGDLGEVTARALRSFQSKEDGLESTGEADDATLEQLIDVYLGGKSP